MKTLSLFLALACLSLVSSRADEASASTFFEKAGARLSKDSDGNVVKLFHNGKPELSVADLQKIGELSHLQEIALNSPKAGDDEWGFLKKLPNLKQLTIWHCKTISSLACFSDLKIEGITVGGSMGLRDLNRESPEKQRDVVLTLKNLPYLKRANLYHSPTVSTDQIIAHLAENFPKLEDLKVDFAAPRTLETAISPNGMKQLAELPLTVIGLENVHSLTPEHMKALAESKSLEAVLIDVRRGGVDAEPLAAALKAANSDLEVVVADESATGPPRRARK